MATSRFCTFVPAPHFSVLPIKTRTAPALILSNRSCFALSVFASWINAISFSGMPRSISLCFKSLYASKSLPYSYSEYGFFGVDKSQNTSCVPLMSAELFHSSYTLSAQKLSLLPFSSERDGSIHLGSSASFFPSPVTFNMLSICGSTPPA